MQFTEVSVALIDVQKRAAGRLLWQFRRSPVLLSVLHALVDEIQVFIDACVQVQQSRMPYDARGEQLEVIGRIVGQNRVLIDYSAINWFAPDSATNAPDRSPAWCVGAPLYDVGYANDELFRILIQAKVYRNFVQYGSIPEIQEAVKEAFGIPVSFQPYIGGALDWVLLVPHTIPLYVLGFLTNQADTVRADAEYLPPYPATVKICQTMLLFDNTFRPDVEGCGADQGKATVGFVF